MNGTGNLTFSNSYIFSITVSITDFTGLFNEKQNRVNLNNGINIIIPPKCQVYADALMLAVHNGFHAQSLKRCIDEHRK